MPLIRMHNPSNDEETSLTVVMWLIPVYVLLAGASPSIVRAGIMGMIGLYAARRRL